MVKHCLILDMKKSDKTLLDQYPWQRGAFFDEIVELLGCLGEAIQRWGELIYWAFYGMKPFKPEPTTVEQIRQWAEDRAIHIQPDWMSAPWALVLYWDRGWLNVNNEGYAVRKDHKTDADGYVWRWNADKQDFDKTGIEWTMFWHPEIERRL